MSDAASTSYPSTPATSETVIHWSATPQAPKKAKAKSKTLEYLKPTVYKAEVEIEKPTKAEADILDALSRAGVRKSSSPNDKKSTKVQYPAPRKLLISIVDGKTGRTIHKSVPTHLLTRASSKAAEVLEAKPWAGRYKVYGKYDLSSITSVVHAITLSNSMPFTTDLSANLLNYEACIRLGIAPKHTLMKPLLSAINAQIARTPITPEILGFVTYRLGSADRVFKHTANVLCHQRFKGEVQDIKAFEQMVARKPALQRAMVQIDQAHKERRERIWKEKREWRKPEVGEKEVGDAVAGTLEVASVKEADVKQKEELLRILKGETGAKSVGNVGSSEEIGDVLEAEKIE